MHSDIIKLSALKSAIIRDLLVVDRAATVMEAIALMSGGRSQCDADSNSDIHQQEFLQESRSSCVFVVEDRKVIGIMTERDVVRLSAQTQNLDRLLVSEVMAHPLVTLHESALTDLFLAVNLIQQFRIRHLPILDEQDCLVGMVTHESLRQVSRPIDLMRLRLVSEVMTGDVVCAESDCSMLAIAQLMATQNVSSVIIVEVIGNEPSLRRPIGIVTERDIVQFQALGLNLASYQAITVMSAPIFAVTKEDTLWTVHQIMEQRLIRRLAVTGELGELLGIVTQTSLLNALNPTEIYNLAKILEVKVLQLEAEKLELLEDRNVELERQVAERTTSLLKKAERERLVGKIAERIRVSMNLQEVLDVCVTEVRAFLQCDRVIVYQFQPDWSGLIIAESVDQDLPSSLGNQIQDSCFQEQTSTLYAHDTPISVNNIYIAGYTDCHVRLLEEYQVKSNVVVPIRASGELWGLLIGHQCTDYRDWQADDVRFLQDISVQFAIVIQQAIAYEKLQTELQAKEVAKALIQQQLTESIAWQDRYETVGQVIGQVLYEYNFSTALITWGANAKLIFGYAYSELPLQLDGWMNLIHPEDRSHFQEVLERTSVDKTPLFAQYRILHRDGHYIWMEDRNQRLYDLMGNGIGVIGAIADISDRKLTELALRQSEQMNRTIVETMPDFLIQMDRNGVYQHRSGGASNVRVIMPANPSAYIRIENVLPDHLVKEQLHYANLALDSGELQIYEQIVDFDDERRYEEVRVAPLDNQEVLMIIRDITDRKRTEFTLQKLLEGTATVTGEDFFPALVIRIAEALGVSYTFITELVDDKLHSLAFCANGDLQPTFSYSPPTTPCELVLNDGEYYCERDLQTIFPEDLDLVALNAESYLGIVLKDHQSHAIGHLCILDVKPLTQFKITEAMSILKVFAARAAVELQRNRAEKALLQINQSLEAKVRERTQELWQINKIQRAILDGTDYAIISVDVNGIIQTFNTGAEKMLGYSMGEVIGQVTPEIYHDAQELSDKVAKASKILGKDIGVGFEALKYMGREGLLDEEWIFIRKDGLSFPVSLSVTVLRDDNGQIIGALSVTKDISDRKRAEAQLQQTNEELVRATRLKDEFLANMSHELRTPLNAILGLSNALKEKLLGSLTEAQLNAIGIVESSGIHLLELINDILDLSKISSGMVELKIEPASVANLCDSSLVFIKQLAFQKEVEIYSNIPQNINKIDVEERRIKQVLINLLSNAVKFTPSGGKVSLLVAIGSGDTWQGVATIPQQIRDMNSPVIVFQVTDTGIGIAPEDLQRLFQPFVQLDSALNRQYEGTGLGLALVKKIVELHGGQVIAESQIGMGSCFTVALPYEMFGSSAPSTDITDDTRRSISANSGKAIVPLILLAEDNEANIATLTAYLTALNYRVVIARNGEEAVAMAKAHSPDAIIMDIQMPRMDGLTAIRLIRTDPQIAAIPIIALTALAMEGDRKRCLEAGANEYLTKPIMFQQLNKAIQQILAQ